MKFVIWGHKLHESTHGYIHNSYNKAFRYLGYETYWVDENDDLSSIDFSDVVFFVEGSRSRGIPKLKNCKYITHHLNTEKLTSEGVLYNNILKLGNYLPREEIHERIEDLAYWDKNTRTLYQCWGTDLLPHEININDYVKFDSSRKTLNYVASLYDQGFWWAGEFATILNRDFNVEFKVFTQNVSDLENFQLIRNSFLCPDFRSDWHLECGYIPCRMWKNISYGRIVGTNSPYVKKALGEYSVFGGTPETLYQNLLTSEINASINMKEAMMFVRDNHTFINRVNTILKLL